MIKHLQKQPIIIIGGRSLVAPYLIQRLNEANLSAEVISRGDLKVPEGFKSISLQLGQTADWHAPEGALVISLLPLSVLSLNLTRFSKAQAIIALGSTDRFVQAKSDDPYDRVVAQNMELAENILKPWCIKNNTFYTILRPTQTYDGVNDNNIAFIARTIGRFGFFPLSGKGAGLRQPIHADDVAMAIMNALGNSSVYNKALNIAGGEILSYRKMVETVFQSMGKRPRIVALPRRVLAKSIKMAGKIGMINVTSIDVGGLQRCNDDFVFENQEGLRLLNYSPRKFEPVMTASRERS